MRDQNQWDLGVIFIELTWNIWYGLRCINHCRI